LQEGIEARSAKSAQLISTHRRPCQSLIKKIATPAHPSNDKALQRTASALIHPTCISCVLRNMRSESRHFSMATAAKISSVLHGARVLLVPRSTQHWHCRTSHVAQSHVALSTGIVARRIVSRLTSHSALALSHVALSHVSRRTQRWHCLTSHIIFSPQFCIFPNYYYFRPFIFKPLLR
jgi:hypothetical protein